MDYTHWRVCAEDVAEIYLRDYLKLANTRDVLGSKVFVKYLWKDAGYRGLALSGPHGCGKHTTAAYMIDDILSKTKNCQFLFLDGGQLNAEFSDPLRLRDYIEALVQDTAEGKKYSRNENDPNTVECTVSMDGCYDLCFVIQSPESYRHWTVLSDLLYQATVLSLEGDLPFRVFTVLISDDRLSLPGMFQRYICSIEVCIPGITRREQFLEQVAKDVFAYISKETALERTEGMSYGQMVNFAQNIRLFINDFSGNDLQEFLKTQAPTPSPTELIQEYGEMLLERLSHMEREISNALGCLTKVLTESADQLVRTLPELSEKLSAASMNTASDPMDTQPDFGSMGQLEVSEAEMGQKIRAELNAMQPNQAMIQIYGKEKLCEFFPEAAEAINNV